MLALIWPVLLSMSQYGCSQSPLFERQETLAVAEVAGAALAVTTTNGAINVAKNGRGDVQIVAKIHAESEARARATKVIAERGADQTLSIRVEWPDGRAHSREGCDFEIAVPESNGVTLVTDNGQLHIADLAGAANLQSSNGRIEVDNHAGPIAATTINGEVNIAGATASVKAGATNGALKIALAPESPGPVELETTNGAIELAVGPAFAGKLSLETTIGMISIDESVEGRRVESDGHHVELAFGPSDAQSSASTVTGAVHVGMIDQ